MSEQDQHPVIQPEQPTAPLTIVIDVPRVIRMHRVTEEEIDSLTSSHESVFLAVASAAFAGFFAAFVATVTVAMDAVTHGGFVAAWITCLALTIVFGAMAVRDWRRGKTAVDQIKARIRSRE